MASLPSNAGFFEEGGAAVAGQRAQASAKRPTSPSTPPATASRTQASRVSRPSFSDVFLRSHSSPTVSSGGSAVSLGSSPPIASAQINGFNNLLNYSSSSLGMLGQNLKTAIRPAATNPSTNSLDRFPSPPLRARSSFGANQQHYLASALLNGDHGKSTTRSPPGTPPRTPSASSIRPRDEKTPYVSGFQPQGVYRSMTEDFTAVRLRKSEGRRLEVARLQRRLDKLVELHYPHPSAVGNGQAEQLEDIAHTQSTWRNSRAMTATDMWSVVKRSVKTNLAKRHEDLRIAEQIIVTWEDDRGITRCPICLIPFSLTIRKHHCRLCGRVVCAVPPNSSAPPVGRTSCCSTFWQYEWLSPELKEKGGLVVEVETVTSTEEVRERDGVRSCRECLTTILRQQAIHHKPRLPMWYKLHESLLRLQKEIDDALPALQELVVSTANLTSEGQQTTLASMTSAQRTALLSSRKKVVSLLASFDAMAKRIRDLPLGPDHQQNGAQHRLQRSIANRAAIFLQERMGLLKGMGSFDEMPPTTAKVPIIKVDLERQKTLEERSTMLVVLLEQEQLVQSYLDDAQSRRQLVDSASLKANLADIQAEIQRLKDEA